MRAKNSLLTLAILSVFLGSCSDDITPTTTDKPNSNIKTYFRSGSKNSNDPSNTPGEGPNKVRVSYDRLYSWMTNDHIWMYHETEGWVQNDWSNVWEEKPGADFGFSEECSLDEYKVRYTGRSYNEDSKYYSQNNYNEVTIASEQKQNLPNVSDHIAEDGDCAVATAQRTGENEFIFGLKHKAHILVFTPRVNLNREPEMCYIKEIKITDLDGDTLAGTYAFNDNGLVMDETVQNASSTVIFRPTTSSSLFQVKNVTSAKHNASYVVIQPGKHRLKIEYTIGYGETWAVEWKNNTYVYNTKAENYKTYTKYLPAGTKDGASDSNVESAEESYYSFEPGAISRISHKLPYDGYDVEFAFEIPYAYYQWDARAWIFSEHEGHWNESGTYEKNYIKGLNQISQTNGVDCQNKGFIENAYVNNGEEWYWKWRCHRAGTDEGQYSCNHTYKNEGESIDEDKMNVSIPNVNEMTWYMMHGDVHYDKDTEWGLQDFRGGEATFRDGKAIFKGGLWILRREYIAGFSAEEAVDNTGSSAGDLTQTFPEEFMYNKNPARWKKNPKKGKPAESEIHKYFFLPLLGCFEVKKYSADTEYVAPAQYRFVAARAFYWTSTPYIWEEKEGLDARSAYYFYYDMGYNYMSISAADHVQGLNNNRWQGYVANKRPEHWWIKDNLTSRQWFQ